MTAPAFASADPSLERAVRYATIRLQGYGSPFTPAIAGERARNLLSAVIAGEPPAVVGEEMLARLLPEDPAVRRALGRAVGRIWAGIEDGWSDLALESLATGRVVTVEVFADEAYGEDGAIARACRLHRGLIETRARPVLVGPQRWRVTMLPWGSL